MHDYVVPIKVQAARYITRAKPRLLKWEAQEQGQYLVSVWKVCVLVQILSANLADIDQRNSLGKGMSCRGTRKNLLHVLASLASS